MEGSQGTFVYTDELLPVFEQYLSNERLAAYYSIARGDRWMGIQLYERNTSISEALYGVVQSLEITLRNAIHNKMSDALKSPHWFDAFTLDKHEQDAVLKAKDTLTEKGLGVTPGRIVSELTFGFWVNLLSWKYEKTLWVWYLHRIFPPKMKRNLIHGRLVELKTLRNRIAHHERILGKRKLPEDYASLIETIGWINPEIKGWVCHTNCFNERWTKKLKKKRDASPGTSATPARMVDVQTGVQKVSNHVARHPVSSPDTTLSD